MASIRVKFNGNLGLIAFDSFVGILGHSLSVLQDLDRRFSEQRGGAIKWVLTGLGEDHLSFVEIGTRLIRGEIDYAPQIIREFTSGIRHIQSEEATPPHFSNDNVREVHKIVQQMNRNGVKGVEYLNLTQVQEIPDEATITPEAGPVIEKLVNVRYRALGAIEGKIELVSVKPRARRFNITHGRTLRSIRCSLPEEIEPSVLDAIRDRRRVIVTGLIGYNAKHEPVTLEVQERLRFLGKEEALPSITELAGSDPDLTGSMSTEEYVRSLRDG